MPALRPEIKYAAVGALVLALGLSYFNQYPLYGWGHYLLALIWALAAAGTAWALGGRVAERFLPPECSRLEQFLFGLTLGWGILALILFALGIFSLWTPLVCRGLVIAGALFGAWDLKRRFPGSLAFRYEIPLPVYLVGGITFLAALSPIIYYDSMVYHLALPSAYIQAGHWVSLKELVYSAFPQNLEMLWTLGLLLHSDTVANLISLMLAGLTVIAIYSWGRRFLDRDSARVAAALFALMPAFLLLSSGGYVDMGLALFTFMSLYALTLWWPTRRLSYLVIPGILAGLAMGTKYTGGLAIGIGALLIVTRMGRLPDDRQRILPALGAFIGCATAIFLPWAIKNWHFYGNPIFPFLYQWGDPAKSPWGLSAAAEGYFRQLVEYESRHLWQLPVLIWEVVARGMNFGGGMDVLGNYGWAPLVALLPAVALSRQRDWPVRILIFYSILYFSVWGMTRPVLRFLLPLAPVLALMAGHGWAKGLQEAPRWLRLLNRGVVTLLLVSGGFLYSQAIDVLGPFRVPLGMESRDSYLKRQLPYYAGAQALTQLVDSTSHTLIVGDQQSYYYQRRITAPTVFSRHPISRLADQSGSPLELRAELRNQWTHLMVHPMEMRRLANYNAFQLSEKGRENWEGLLQLLGEPLYKDPACVIYTL